MDVLLMQDDLLRIDQGTWTFSSSTSSATSSDDSGVGRGLRAGTTPIAVFASTLPAKQPWPS